MFEDEKFEKVGETGKGALIAKFPGIDINLLYDNGMAYVNEKGTIGYVALQIRDMHAEEYRKSKNLSFHLGRHLVDMLADPEVKQLMRQALAEEDTYLFYSRAEQGLDVLTMLGMANQHGIDDTSFDHMVIATFVADGRAPPVQGVYGLHLQAIGDRKLIENRAELEKEIIKLPLKANQVYEKALELIISMGF